MADKTDDKGSPQQQLINIQAQQLAAQVANWAAQLEFQKERMRLLELPEMQGKLQIEIDRLAWDKAQDAWENAFKESALTGTYNGMPTVEWLTQQAQLTGVLGGQQTLQGKLTDAQVKQMNEQMALANAQFLSGATGYINGQKTFDRQKWEASQATDAWKFLATLTGPANAFKQARAIGSMPGGQSDIMKAWAGEFSPAGFAGVGSGGQASLEGLLEGGGPDSPYYYQPPQQPYGPTYMPEPYYGYPYGGSPYGPGGGGSPEQPGLPTYVPAPGQVGPPGASPGTAPPTAPPTTSPGTPPTTTPGPASGAMDSGFYVWLRAHGLDPGNPSMRDRLPEFIHNYMSLPAGDHQQYVEVGQRNPGMYQFDTSGWLDVVSMGFSPLPGQITANPNVPQITQAQYGEGATPPDAATQAQHLASQGGRQGYWVQRNGTWTFIAGSPVPAMGPVDRPVGITDPGFDPNAGQNRMGSLQPWRPSYVDPRQYAEFDALPESTKQAYYAESQNPSPTFAGSSYTYQPSGVQAPAHQWNYSPTPGGSMNVTPPGVRSDFSTPDISTPFAISPGSAWNLYQYGATDYGTSPTAKYGTAYNPNTGGGWKQPSWGQMAYAQAQTGIGAGQQPQYGSGTSSPFGPNPWAQNSLTLPNQINARNYNNSYAYQKELGWAGYEDAGWDKALAQEAFEKSLPKWGGPKRGSFSF